MSELRDLVRDVVTGEDGDPWETLSGVGLTAVGVPEEAGGSGGETGDLVEVAESLAEHGAAVPLAEHATACWALAGSGTLPALGTVAFSGPPAGAGRLTVPWGSRASHVLVLAAHEPPAVLDTVSDGVVVTRGSDVAGQPLDEIEAPATALTTLPNLSAEAVSARLALLRCAAMVGAARGAYALTHGHVRAREQFGRPLVKLPAVGTALARFRVEVIQAETALAGALAAAGTPRALSAATAARIVCGPAATEAARLAHQLHGAMGITQEYALHRLTRLLWALRDADLPEEHWATAFGEQVLEAGEPHLWDELTAVRTSRTAWRVAGNDLTSM